ncbi:MAG: alkaline phosphatase PhoX [Acidimicrobiales bacterium]
MRSSFGLRATSFLAGAAMLSGVAALPTPAAANGGFLTEKDPYITLAADAPAGSTVKAILSVGEDAGVSGFKFQGIPDGIGIVPGEGSTVDVYVAHEETSIPFRGSADFQNASLSKLTLDTAPGSSQGAVLDASVAIGPEEGFVRFCSASVAGPNEGLSKHYVFVGEESSNPVPVPPDAIYPADASLAPDRQAGYNVVLDHETGEFTEVAGMGRLNHENTIVVPGGWSRHAMLTTDDTFAAPSSQLYMYLASLERHIMLDRGSLWAFQVTHDDDGKVKANDAFNDANDYLDIGVGDDFRGRFIRVPKHIAKGLTGTENAQDQLENWSNENNVFQFIRLEDIAYDVNNPRVVYIADTGATRVIPDPETGRLQRGVSGTVGSADNGRIYRFEFNEKNPRIVDSFSVLADGDAPGSDEFVSFTSPDNLDTSSNSLMVQEDTSEAKIWRHDFASGEWTVVATVNDPRGESSGIVDASEWFGEGTWLLDVQAHGTLLETAPGPDNTTLKLEDGQLMLLNVPGS